MFKVSGLTSTKTGLAPARITAFAVDTNVNEGMITSSPGSRSQSIAANSRAEVHDGVINTLGIANRSSINLAQARVKKPSAAIFLLVIALVMYSSSFPVMKGLLKGILGGKLTSLVA
jgi:hypothetical protein